MTTSIFEPPSLYDTGALIRSHDHRNRHDCFTMPSFIWDSQKLCSVSRAKNEIFLGEEHDWWGELGGGMTTLHTITNYLYSEKNTDLLKSFNRSNREDIKSFDE